LLLLLLVGLLRVDKLFVFIQEPFLQLIIGLRVRA